MKWVILVPSLLLSFWLAACSPKQDENTMASLAPALTFSANAMDQAVQIRPDISGKVYRSPTSIVLPPAYSTPATITLVLPAIIPPFLDASVTLENTQVVANVAAKISAQDASELNRVVTLELIFTDGLTIESLCRATRLSIRLTTSDSAYTVTVPLLPPASIGAHRIPHPVQALAFLANYYPKGYSAADAIAVTNASTTSVTISIDPSAIRAATGAPESTLIQCFSENDVHELSISACTTSLRPHADLVVLLLTTTNIQERCPQCLARVAIQKETISIAVTARYPDAAPGSPAGPFLIYR